MRSRNKKEDFPDYSDELTRLSKVMGQIAGIERMIRARRYCPEIIQQIRAARSALMALELAVMKGHMASCIKSSARSDSPADFDRKLKELLELIKG